MNSKIEVLSVTSEEVIRILGSLETDEIDQLLDKIRILRGDTLPEKTMMLAR